MPTVSIGTIDKRINSTKQTFSSSFSADCKLKEPCSMHNPVFIVQGLSKSNFYNYCQFEGRYYWIDDIVYETRDIQNVSCHLDPLATYKNAIKATSAWVKYGDSGHWNKKIDDLRMQPEIQAVSAVATVDDIFAVPFDPTGGSVIMRVMETMPSSSNQGVKTYAMSYSTFKYCLADLTGFMDGITQGIGPTITDLVQALGTIWAAIGGQGSWRDNILSCTYLPINISFYQAVGTHEGVIALGSIPAGTGRDFYDIHPISIVKNSGSLTIPWASDAQTYEFLKNPRWCAFQVQTPGGYQDIDPTDLRDQQSFGFFSALDICSGEWSCKVTEGYIDTGEIVASFGGKLGIDIMGQVGSAASYAQTFGVGAMSAIRAGLGDASVVTQIGESKTVTGATVTEIRSASGDIKTTRTEGKTNTTPVYKTEGSGISGSFLPSGISVGSASGTIGGGATNMFLFNSTNAGSIIVKGIQYKPNDLAQYTAFCDKYGYPCNAFLTLGDVTGFVQCVGASVDTAAGATTEDKATINSFLNGGLYIE